MSLNKKKKKTKPAVSPQATANVGAVDTSAASNTLTQAAKDKLSSITGTAKGMLSNSSAGPAVPNITTPSPKGTNLEKGIASVVTTGAKVVGSLALAAALVCVASGIAQDYARKKRYKAGSGSFWTFLATIPSFKHPRPFFYKIASFVNGRYIGDENAGAIYKRFCLVPAVKQNSTIHLLDNWGGWLSLYLDKGDGSELVISHDKGNGTIRVLTDDLAVVEYELPPQAEVATLIYTTESL